MPRSWRSTFYLPHFVKRKPVPSLTSIRWTDADRPHRPPHRLSAAQHYRDSRRHRRDLTVWSPVRGIARTWCLQWQTVPARSCADSWTAEAAQIVAAHPDLVIASVPYQEKAVSEILKSGSRFLGFAPKNLADIYTDIATIAGVVGAASAAKRYLGDAAANRPSARTRAAASSRPRVFCEEWGKPLIASQTWVAELVEAAGGEFVGEPGRTGGCRRNSRLDPEVIITAWCGAGDRVPLEKIIARPRMATDLGRTVWPRILHSR